VVSLFLLCTRLKLFVLRSHRALIVPVSSADLSVLSQQGNKTGEPALRRNRTCRRICDWAKGTYEDPNKASYLSVSSLFACAPPPLRRRVQCKARGAVHTPGEAKAGTVVTADDDQDQGNLKWTQKYLWRHVPCCHGASSASTTRAERAASNSLAGGSSAQPHWVPRRNVR
jgi:hypothetical protein